MCFLLAVATPASAPTAGPTTRPEDVLAIVLGRPITRGEVERGPEKYARDHERRLLGQMLSILLDEYRRVHGIVATDAEIADFAEAMEKIVRENAQRRGEPPTTQPFKQFPEVCKQFVLTWKVSKSLYERYGGTVIFNQGNPTEPIGAYRALLVEAKKRGHLRVLDSKYVELLGRSFERALPDDQRGWVIPPEKVDFTKPWWRQEPRK